MRIDLHVHTRASDDALSSLAVWIAKQSLNAQREVERLRVEIPGANSEDTAASMRSEERPTRRWLRDRLWVRLPRFWRPFLYFLYRYVVRGGFLDGRAGFAFCFLHGLWYPLLIDMMQEEDQQ